MLDMEIWESQQIQEMKKTLKLKIRLAQHVCRVLISRNKSRPALFGHFLHLSGPQNKQKQR